MRMTGWWERCEQLDPLHQGLPCAYDRLVGEVRAARPSVPGVCMTVWWERCEQLDPLHQGLPCVHDRLVGEV